MSSSTEARLAQDELKEWDGEQSLLSDYFSEIVTGDDPVQSRIAFEAGIKAARAHNLEILDEVMIAKGAPIQALGTINDAVDYIRNLKFSSKSISMVTLSQITTGILLYTSSMTGSETPAVTQRGGGSYSMTQSTDSIVSNALSRSFKIGGVKTQTELIEAAARKQRDFVESLMPGNQLNNRVNEYGQIIKSSDYENLVENYATRFAIVTMLDILGDLASVAKPATHWKDTHQIRSGFFTVMKALKDSGVSAEFLTDSGIGSILATMYDVKVKFASGVMPSGDELSNQLQSLSSQVQVELLGLPRIGRSVSIVDFVDSPLDNGQLTLMKSSTLIRTKDGETNRLAVEMLECFDDFSYRVEKRMKESMTAGRSVDQFGAYAIDDIPISTGNVRKLRDRVIGVVRRSRRRNFKFEADGMCAVNSMYQPQTGLGLGSIPMSLDMYCSAMNKAKALVRAMLVAASLVDDEENFLIMGKAYHCSAIIVVDFFSDLATRINADTRVQVLTATSYSPYVAGIVRNITTSDRTTIKDYAPVLTFGTRQTKYKELSYTDFDEPHRRRVPTVNDFTSVMGTRVGRGDVRYHDGDTRTTLTANFEARKIVSLSERIPIPRCSLIEALTHLDLLEDSAKEVADVTGWPTSVKRKESNKPVPSFEDLYKGRVPFTIKDKLLSAVQGYNNASGYVSGFSSDQQASYFRAMLAVSDESVDFRYASEKEFSKHYGLHIDLRELGLFGKRSVKLNHALSSTCYMMRSWRSQGLMSAASGYEKATGFSLGCTKPTPYMESVVLSQPTINGPIKILFQSESRDGDSAKRTTLTGDASGGTMLHPRVPMLSKSKVVNVESSLIPYLSIRVDSSLGNTSAVMTSKFLKKYAISGQPADSEIYTEGLTADERTALSSLEELYGDGDSSLPSTGGSDDPSAMTVEEIRDITNSFSNGDLRVGMLDAKYSCFVKDDQNPTIAMTVRGLLFLVRLAEVRKIIREKGLVEVVKDDSIVEYALQFYAGMTDIVTMLINSNTRSDAPIVLDMLVNDDEAKLSSGTGTWSRSDAMTSVNYMSYLRTGDVRSIIRLGELRLKRMGGAPVDDDENVYSLKVSDYYDADAGRGQDGDGDYEPLTTVNIFKLLEVEGLEDDTVLAGPVDDFHSDATSEQESSADDSAAASDDEDGSESVGGNDDLLSGNTDDDDKDVEEGGEEEEGGEDDEDEEEDDVDDEEDGNDDEEDDEEDEGNSALNRFRILSEEKPDYKIVGGVSILLKVKDGTGGHIRTSIFTLGSNSSEEDVIKFLRYVMSGSSFLLVTGRSTIKDLSKRSNTQAIVDSVGLTGMSRAFSVKFDGTKVVSSAPYETPLQLFERVGSIVRERIDKLKKAGKADEWKQFVRSIYNFLRLSRIQEGRTSAFSDARVPTFGIRSPYYVTSMVGINQYDKVISLVSFMLSKDIDHDPVSYNGAEIVEATINGNFVSPAIGVLVTKLKGLPLISLFPQCSTEETDTLDKAYNSFPGYYAIIGKVRMLADKLSLSAFSDDAELRLDFNGSEVLKAILSAERDIITSMVISFSSQTAL